MPNKACLTCRRWILLPLLLGVLPVPASAQPAASAPPAAPAPQAESELPEYRTKSLPTDTFKPSEEVSEDYAVPFPADI